MDKLKFGIFVLLLVNCRSTPINCARVEYLNGISFYENEPFSGECFSFYPTGVINSHQQYKKGLDHGEWKFYYKNSKIETVSYFNNGKRIGNWRYFYYNGNLKQESYYNDLGEKKGVWLVFNEKGDTIKKINHDN